MTHLVLQNFLGEIPRMSPDLLPAMAAQEAQNNDIMSGEIRPIHGNLPVYTPPVADNYIAAFHAVYGTLDKWRAWTQDVDVAKGPFSSQVEPRYYWTGDGVPKYATFTNFGAVDTPLGMPQPANAPSVTMSGGSQPVINRAYCYTFYRAATGEESAPSPPSALVAGAPDGTWNVIVSAATSADTPVDGWDATGVTVRIYRTSGSAAAFQLVAEVAMSATYADTLSDTAIMGDELISQNWLPPVASMQGLIALPNGSLCGFDGTQLMFSEPYQPHAWPKAYTYGVDYPIVGIAAYGTTVVVATAAGAFLAVGSDPGAMSVQSAGATWPCTAKRSMISVGDGVLYATPDGLAYIGDSGARIFTESIFTRDTWIPLLSPEMSCAFLDQRIYVMCRPPSGALSMLIIVPGENWQVTRSAETARTLYVDANTATLCLVDKTVQAWNVDSAALKDYNWLSKPITLPTPVNFGAASVAYSYTASAAAFASSQAEYDSSIRDNEARIADPFARGASNCDPFDVIPLGGSRITQPQGAHLFTDASGNTGGAAGHAAVTFYFDDNPVTVQALDGVPFRLPSGFKARKLAIRVTGNVAVKNVKLAETMMELAAV